MDKDVVLLPGRRDHGVGWNERKREKACMNGHSRRVLTSAQVASACELIDRGGYTVKAMAARLGVHRSTLYRAIRQDVVDRILHIGRYSVGVPMSPGRRRAMVREAARESRLANRADTEDAELERFLDDALDDITDLE